MRYILQLLLVATLLFWSGMTSVMAQQGIITGIVVDSDGNETLPGANVYLQSSISTGTVTDIDGSFVLNGVPAGSQILVVSFAGFAKEEIAVEVVDGGKTELTVEMAPAAILGEEVIVTAQALGQAKAINQQLNSDAIANFISADKIKELPDVNAAEAISRLPGVSINRSGGEGQKVVIRGLEPKFNAITVNGVRLPANSGTDRSVDLSMISPELLDGIEVYKSPLPDMDAEAVGGTVNLRLRKAPSDPTTLVRGLVGYNDNNSYFGDYKGVLQHSRRFFDGKVGIAAQVNTERFNRGGDILSFGWSQGETDPVTGVTSILGSNLRLEDRSEQRGRNNASVNLDYSAGKSDFGFLGLFSNTSRDRFIVENRYDPNSGIRYNANGIDSDLNLFMGAFTGVHKLSKFTIDWVASGSRSIGETPYNFSLSVVDDQTPFDPELDRMGNPANFLAAANPNLATAILKENDNRNSRTLENNQEFGVNFKVPVELTDGIGGFLKTGFRYRSINREREVSGLGEPLYDLGTQVTQKARDAFDGELIFSEANPQLISLANFVQPGDGINFEDREGEVVDFDVVLNEGLIRNWYEQQREVLRPNLNAEVDNFKVNETVTAFYLMGKINFGKKLSVTPGFRYEYSDNRYDAGVSSITDPFLGTAGSTRDTTTFQQYGEFLPHLHIKYEPSNWLDVRFSYANTLARPDYSFISPRTQINDNTLNITAGNPNLRHMRVENYDLSVTAYKGGLGLLTVGGFYKNIDNIFTPQSLQLVGDALVERNYPGFEGYVLNSFSNFPTSRVYGFEVDLQTNLNFLPAPFNGLVVNANYSRIFSETSAFFLTSETFFFPFFRVEFESNARTVSMPSQVPNIVNLSLGYDYKGFSARISGNHQGTKASVFSQNKDFDSFILSFWRWDASVKQKVGEKLSFFLNINNISNQRDISFIRDQRFISRVETYGTTGTIGAQLKL